MAWLYGEGGRPRHTVINSYSFFLLSRTLPSTHFLIVFNVSLCVRAGEGCVEYIYAAEDCIWCMAARIWRDKVEAPPVCAVEAVLLFEAGSVRCKSKRREGGGPL
jgi:hypothetical protein